MDRFLRYGRTAAIWTCLAASLGLAGCAKPLSTIMYLATGNNAPAACTALQKKRVAVVCRVPPSLEFRSGSAARDLATLVGRNLKQKGNKIEVVDSKEVERFMDENSWDDPTEVGQAVDAEMVVAIDLESFTLMEHQTLYRGKANVSIKVYDMKTKEVVWEEFPPQTIYPPNTGVPTTERQTPQFQREFLAVVANDIGEKFYDHDNYNRYAADTNAFDR